MRHRKQNCSSFSDCLHYFNSRDRCSSTFLYIVINDDDFGCLLFVFRWNMCECVSEVENVSSSEFLLIKEITFVLWLRLLRLYLCLRELLLSWPHFGSFVLCFSFLLSPLLSLPQLSPLSLLTLSLLPLSPVMSAKTFPAPGVAVRRWRRYCRSNCHRPDGSTRRPPSFDPHLRRRYRTVSPYLVEEVFARTWHPGMRRPKVFFSYDERWR